jgi:hypothetical protein
MLYSMHLHEIDVVLNHPGLKFLGENPMFQERYSKVIIKIFISSEPSHFFSKTTTSTVTTQLRL